jgi:SAM-dependent methyltransferase
MSTAWDYSKLAKYYDKRADYSLEAIAALLGVARRDFPDLRAVADIGAGTGKLTCLLMDNGLDIDAVEPNNEMRAFGQQNSARRRHGKVQWHVGTGERTGLAPGKFQLVTFGSSFNVTDRAKALQETSRILVPGGWFACMWNHRDLDDPLQARIERVIAGLVPGYNYGSRREDQTSVIRASGLFGDVVRIEGPVTFHISKADYVDAWLSHATLERQAGGDFQRVVKAIEREVGDVESLAVPYTTRIWCARLLRGRG